MNKVRARLSSPQPTITDVYEEERTTLPPVMEIQTTTATTTSSTTSKTTTRSTTASTTVTSTTMATTKVTSPVTFVSTVAKTTTLKSSSVTPATTARTSEPNTKIFRSSNNGLSNVINRGREKLHIITSPSPVTVFLTPLTEGSHRIGFEKTITTTTTRKPVFLANSKPRTTKPTMPPHGKLLNDDYFRRYFQSAAALGTSFFVTPFLYFFRLFRFPTFLKSIPLYSDCSDNLNNCYGRWLPLMICCWTWASSSKTQWGGGYLGDTPTASYDNNIIIPGIRLQNDHKMISALVHPPLLTVTTQTR